MARKRTPDVEPPDGGEAEERRIIANHLRLHERRGLVGWWTIDPMDWDQEEIIGWTPGDH